jgi:hypothetical protein
MYTCVILGMYVWCSREVHGVPSWLRCCFVRSLFLLYICMYNATDTCPFGFVSDFLAIQYHTTQAVGAAAGASQGQGTLDGLINELVVPVRTVYTYIHTYIHKNKHMNLLHLGCVLVLVTFTWCPPGTFHEFMSAKRFVAYYLDVCFELACYVLNISCSHVSFPAVMYHFLQSCIISCSHVSFPAFMCQVDSRSILRNSTRWNMPWSSMLLLYAHAHSTLACFIANNHTHVMLMLMLQLSKDRVSVVRIAAVHALKQVRTAGIRACDVLRHWL